MQNKAGTRVVFKMIAPHKPMDRYFAKYERLFNSFHEKIHNLVFIERIEGGILWFVTSLEAFRGIIAGFPKDLPVILRNLKLWPDLKKELINYFNFDTGELDVIIECISHSSSEIGPVLDEYFQKMNPGITMKIIGDKRFMMHFPDVDAITDYLAALYMRAA